MVLWHRADGYLLNTAYQRTDWHFPAPEVWTDPWPTKTEVVVAATTAVQEVDAVGQVRRIPVTGGKATLTLDGAPRIYHGLAPRTDGQGHHTLSRSSRSRRPGEPRSGGHR